MIEPKVSLSLLVPGASLLSPQECGKNPKKYNTTTMIVEERTNKKSKGKKEKITISTRKQRLISQHINICKEAFNEMLRLPTSAKLARIIDKKGRREWDKLTLHERLKKHFDLIAEDLGAVSYTYDILDD